MDLQKAKIILDKINSLYNNLAADAGNISNIERDLMRSYIRQLYETTMDFSDAPLTAPKTKPRKKVEIIKPQPRVQATMPPPTVEVEAPAPAPEPKPKPKPTYTPPRVIEIPDSLKEMDVPPPAPAPSPKPEPKPTPPAPAPPPAPRPTPVAEVDEDVQQLFEHKMGKELSDKLSSLPIRDLTKAMGLNDRIAAVNDLFGGDNDAFISAMHALNGLNSFDDAKAWLAQNVVAEYGWTKRNTKKKAKEFIKLIRRRYN